METRLHICKCALDDAAARGKGGGLVTGSIVGVGGVGTTDGGASAGSGGKASRCREKAG